MLSFGTDICLITLRIIRDNTKKCIPVCRRVHISEKTLSYLQGEFEVEPGFGEKREEALRMAGIKTYFICKILKPVSFRQRSTNVQ